jgi:hypothetical protein
MILFSLEQLEPALSSDESIGFCIECGAEHYCCEPDAREYKCEECEQFTVYGAQEILLMGLVE